MAHSLALSNQTSVLNLRGHMQVEQRNATEESKKEESSCSTMAKVAITVGIVAAAAIGIALAFLFAPAVTAFIVTAVVVTAALLAITALFVATARCSSVSVGYGGRSYYPVFFPSYRPHVHVPHDGPHHTPHHTPHRGPHRGPHHTPHGYGGRPHVFVPYGYK